MSQVRRFTTADFLQGTRFSQTGSQTARESQHSRGTYDTQLTMDSSATAQRRTPRFDLLRNFATAGVEIDALSPRSQGTTVTQAEVVHIEELRILQDLGVDEMARKIQGRVTIHVVEPRPFLVSFGWGDMGIPYLFQRLFFPLELIRANEVARSLMLSLMFFIFLIVQIIQLSLGEKSNTATFIYRIALIAPVALLYVASRSKLVDMVANGLPYMITATVMCSIAINGPNMEYPHQLSLVTYAIMLAIATMCNITTSRANLIHGLLAILSSVIIGMALDWEKQDLIRVCSGILIVFIFTMMVSYLRDNFRRNPIPAILSSNIPVAYYSHDFRLIETNTAFQRFYRIRADRQYMLANFVQTESDIEQLCDVQPSNTHLGVGMKADGEDFWALVTFSKVFFSYSYAAIIVHNLTFEADSQRKTERLNQKKDEIKTNISSLANENHDLLLFVAYINAAVSSLRSLTKQYYYINIINSSITIMTHQLRDLLNSLKSKRSLLSVDQKEFSLAKLVEETVQILACYAQQRNIQLASFIDPEISAEYIGDLGRIRRILVNLTVNAIKFTEKGYMVLIVSPQKDGNGVEFKIIDTGIGMTKETLNEVFKAWKQGDTPESISRSNEGYGLGLSSVGQQLKLLKGRIEPKSEPGVGSTFTVSIPLISKTLERFITKNPYLPTINVLLIMEQSPITDLTFRAIEGYTDFPVICEVLSKSEEEVIVFLLTQRRRYSIIFVDHSYQDILDRLFPSDRPGTGAFGHTKLPGDQSQSLDTDTHKHRGISLPAILNPNEPSLRGNDNAKPTLVPGVDEKHPLPRSKIRLEPIHGHTTSYSNMQPTKIESVESYTQNHILGVFFTDEYYQGKRGLDEPHFVLLSNNVIEDQKNSMEYFSAKLYKPLQHNQVKYTISKLINQDSGNSLGADEQKSIRLNVLVADDSSLLCESIRIYLEDRGHTTSFANSGSECINIFRNSFKKDQKMFDLILLDLNMPNQGDGIEACRSIRKFEELCPLSANRTMIYLMSCDEMDDQEIYDSTGADGFIDKTDYNQELSTVLARCQTSKYNQMRKSDKSHGQPQSYDPSRQQGIFAYEKRPIGQPAPGLKINQTEQQYADMPDGTCAADAVPPAYLPDSSSICLPGMAISQTTEISAQMTVQTVALHPALPVHSGIPRSTLYEMDPSTASQNSIPLAAYSPLSVPLYHQPVVPPGSQPMPGKKLPPVSHPQKPVFDSQAQAAKQQENDADVSAYPSLSSIPLPKNLQQPITPQDYTNQTSACKESDTNPDQTAGPSSAGHTQGIVKRLTHVMTKNTHASYVENITSQSIYEKK